MCLDAGNQAPCRTVQGANLLLLTGQGGTSLAIYLATKLPMEHPHAREPSHLENVGQHWL